MPPSTPSTNCTNSGFFTESLAQVERERLDVPEVVALAFEARAAALSNRR